MIEKNHKDVVVLLRPNILLSIRLMVTPGACLRLRSIGHRAREKMCRLLRSSARSVETRACTDEICNTTTWRQNTQSTLSIHKDEYGVNCVCTIKQGILVQCIKQVPDSVL